MTGLICVNIKKCRSDLSLMSVGLFKVFGFAVGINKKFATNRRIKFTNAQTKNQTFWLFLN